MPWDKYYGSKRIYDGMDVGGGNVEDIGRNRVHR